jgi:hypothetical protein
VNKPGHLGCGCGDWVPRGGFREQRRVRNPVGSIAISGCDMDGGRGWEPGVTLRSQDRGQQQL